MRPKEIACARGVGSPSENTFALRRLKGGYGGESRVSIDYAPYEVAGIYDRYNCEKRKKTISWDHSSGHILN